MEDKAAAHQLRLVDKEMGIVMLCRTRDKHGNPFWGYVDVPPSKAPEFMALQGKGKPFKVSDYGTVICSGEGENPPDDIKHKMEELGARHDFLPVLMEALAHKMERK